LHGNCDPCAKERGGKPPYRVDVSESLQAGKNDLHIEVANTWVNRLIGDEQLSLDSQWNDWETLSQWPGWFAEKTKTSPWAIHLHFSTPLQRE